MLPQIRLNRGSSRPIYDQLVAELKRLVLSGALPPGSRLPPTRAVARDLRVSRTVVVEAYEQLKLEGYLEAKVGSGTRVRVSLPAHLLQPETRRVKAARRAPDEVRLSRSGRRLAVESRDARFTARQTMFRPGAIAREYFPARLWARLASRTWRDRVTEIAPYGDPLGLPELRSAIAEHLGRFRAVRCDPGQVMITAGSQQALDLVARLMIDPGDRVALEEPNYLGARAALAAAGARFIPVPVDDQGMNVECAGAALDDARLVYCTPSHQYPLGATMSLERRLRLLDWAKARSAWIIEDDYDSEFRYEGRPLPSLQGLDDAGRVLYVGTFSKVLAPGLRVGFMVLPEPLVVHFRRARLVADQHACLPTQAMLAAFLHDGHLERHIARMRSVYEARREALVSALAPVLRGDVAILPEPAGLHLALRLPRTADDVAIGNRLLAHGIQAPPLSIHYLRRAAPPGLVLGFGGAAPDELRAGTKVLRREITAVR